jgi:hypothetical protein
VKEKRRHVQFERTEREFGMARMARVARLQRFEELDELPALVVGELFAVFVAFVAIAYGVGIEIEGSGGQVEANVEGIELAAADFECLQALTGGK